MLENLPCDAGHLDPKLKLLAPFHQRHLRADATLVRDFLKPFAWDIGFLGLIDDGSRVGRYRALPQSYRDRYSRSVSPSALPSRRRSPDREAPLREERRPVARQLRGVSSSHVTPGRGDEPRHRAVERQRQRPMHERPRDRRRARPARAERARLPDRIPHELSGGVARRERSSAKFAQTVAKERRSVGAVAMSPMYAHAPNETNPPTPINADGPSTTTHPRDSRER